MTQIKLNIPRLNIDEEEYIKFIAAKLFEAGKLSLAEAAKLCKTNTKEFTDILPKYGVSLINYSSEDVLEDVKRI